jgi:hypothetical protein
MKTRTLSKLAVAGLIAAFSTGAIANQWFGDDPYWKSQAAGRAGAKSKPAPVTGHDMNEQNTLAPGMSEQMRREQAQAGSATSANPGHEMNEQNTLAPGMRDQMKKQ